VKTKVLITVKTYPSLSRKHGELVCTAGVREDGSWIRIYPIPFRRLDYANRFQKYQWIEVDLERNHKKDHRPESHRILGLDSLKVLDRITSTENGGWNRRRGHVLRNVKKNMTDLIEEAHDREIGTSLATFKPSKIVDVFFRPDAAEWSPALLAQFRQRNLFKEWDDPFSVVEKIPWRFYFRLEDIHGRESTMMIEDWETGQLYRNCLKTSTSKLEAAEKVRQKYLDMAAKTDIHLYLGTTLRHHFASKNPFIVVGVFSPPPLEPDLFDAV
jgi:hypothetical protein